MPLKIIIFNQREETFEQTQLRDIFEIPQKYISWYIVCHCARVHPSDENNNLYSVVLMHQKQCVAIGKQI